MVVSIGASLQTARVGVCGLRLPALESSSHHLYSCSGVSHLISLHHCFLICKPGDKLALEFPKLRMF